MAHLTLKGGQFGPYVELVVGGSIDLEADNAEDVLRRVRQLQEAGTITDMDARRMRAQLADEAFIARKPFDFGQFLAYARRGLAIIRAIDGNDQESARMRGRLAFMEQYYPLAGPTPLGMATALERVQKAVAEIEAAIMPPPAVLAALVGQAIADNPSIMEEARRNGGHIDLVVYLRKRPERRTSEESSVFAALKRLIDMISGNRR